MCQSINVCACTVCACAVCACAVCVSHLTCTLASVSLVLCASSSLVYTSGYWVRSKALSSSSSCSAVKVVLERRCFRLMGIPGSVSVSLSESDPPPGDTHATGQVRSGRVASGKVRLYEINLYRLIKNIYIHRSVYRVTHIGLYIHTYIKTLKINYSSRKIAVNGGKEIQEKFRTENV